MPKQQVYQLRPHGYENDPEVERYKVSTLDYLTAQTYNNYAIFFRLDDKDKPLVVDTLKGGLERTLAQARHLNGRIEKDAGGGHSFTKRKDDTVRLHVQWLDDPADADIYPSLDDIHKANYSSAFLGDLDLWSVWPMTYGEKPEAKPENNPTTAAFKANLVRGGLVLNMHHHHYANDVMGWAGVAHQLAENCRAIIKNAPFPTWDPACNDLSRLTKADPPEVSKIDGPSPPQRHPDHKIGVALLFHLPKSKAAQLKQLAMPEDGTWVSTYDAFSAFIWRNLTRLRTPVFGPAPDSKIFWSEAIDMRRRMHSPKPPARIQHNVMFAALSATATVEQPTASELISGWALWKVARYVRQLTDSVTQESLDATLDMVATVRDKTSLNIRIDGYPPMSILQTDHRDANMVSADFGFGRPTTYRHLMDCVTEGVIVIYPPRDPSPESDEGPEFSICYEEALAKDLIEDEGFNEFFEYRGVDAVHAAAKKTSPPAGPCLVSV
ncbi:Trichothecene 3-O-acetyltransferase TRI101 [Colletotrichum trifolii]|uniref:Trichothecene 3-O-acetyltransferase TRI101 n=1 Tax=Colletotrichum trifolii TaxID=5466 RepID=A0A4R8S0N6_COLTR|nr:Trichothecene 3-O-acetyltransferase TRI101 [Colletotrichum trifolii]